MCYVWFTVHPRSLRYNMWGSGIEHLNMLRQDGESKITSLWKLEGARTQNASEWQYASLPVYSGSSEFLVGLRKCHLIWYTIDNSLLSDCDNNPIGATFLKLMALFSLLFPNSELIYALWLTCIFLSLTSISRRPLPFWNNHPLLLQLKLQAVLSRTDEEAHGTIAVDDIILVASVECGYEPPGAEVLPPTIPPPTPRPTPTPGFLQSCDFEDYGEPFCGWTDISANEDYKWTIVKVFLDDHPSFILIVIIVKIIIKWWW